MPDNIDLRPIFSYLKDLNPDIVILGGDIIDAKGLHGIQAMPWDRIDRGWYERDVLLLHRFFCDLKRAAPNAEIVYLEGNHEERYRRAMERYPNQFKGQAHLRIYPDAIPEGVKVAWVPYGTSKSFFQLGDTLFMHGVFWEADCHAKRYSAEHLPFRVIYGHMHDHQAYTTKKVLKDLPTMDAETPGCLCTKDPDWKNGRANKWTNGFISFVFDGKQCTFTRYEIVNGRFYVGGKEYGPDSTDAGWTCSRCGGTEALKNGLEESGRQKYRCANCHRKADRMAA